MEHANRDSMGTDFCKMHFKTLLWKPQYVNFRSVCSPTEFVFIDLMFRFTNVVIRQCYLISAVSYFF